MLFTSLNFIKERLNQFLKNQQEISEDVVELANLMDVRHGGATMQSNRIVITLVNIQKETILGKNMLVQYNGEAKASVQYPPLHLNLYILVSACFDDNNYEESLKSLSLVVEYFQSNQVFDHHTAPELDERIERLIFEIVDSDFHQLGQVWNIVGAKYVPSMMYKVRMLKVCTNQVKKEVSVIKGTNAAVNH